MSELHHVVTHFWLCRLWLDLFLGLETEILKYFVLWVFWFRKTCCSLARLFLFALLSIFILTSIFSLLQNCRKRPLFFNFLWFLTLRWRLFMIFFLLFHFELIDFDNNFAISLITLQIFEERRVPDNFFISEWYLESINGILIIEMICDMKFPFSSFDL